ncbi:MAG: DUF4624 family lipoprotein [Ruminococcaceae bacterium]|nr:DUF4624 family lipoprotein [Oscillospiraceae bacterium]
MKKIRYGIIFVFIVALLFSGCAGKSTNLVFSFNTSTPYDSQEEKTIYFNEAHDKITLDAELEINEGSVSVYVYDSNNEAVWSGTYDESGNFQIELKNITADEEYKLEIQTNQTKKAVLNISSWEKLVKSKDKPIH